MAAGKLYHWKHGWIPISAEAKAFKAGKGPKPVTLSSHEKAVKRRALYGPKGPPRRAALQISGMEGFAAAGGMLGDSSSLKDRDTTIPFDPESRLIWGMGAPFFPGRDFFDPHAQEGISEFMQVDPKTGELVNALHKGGFTFDVKKGGLINVGDVKGVAVAVPGTEYPISADLGRDGFRDEMMKFIDKNADAISRGAMIGGWYSEDRNQYMIELTELVQDRKIAAMLGKARHQEAVFDLGTGELIPTGGYGDAQVKSLERKQLGKKQETQFAKLFAGAYDKKGRKKR